MGRKPRAIEILKQMRPEAVRRLALAVFLMFGILGPLTILMESRIRLLSWSFILIQTIASGGMGASIILVMKKRWWYIVLVVMLWSGVMGLNSGGLSFQFDDEGRFRVRLGGVAGQRGTEKSNEPLVLQSSELDAIYVQRGIVGILAIVLLSTGYVMFLRVIKGEVQQRERLEAEVRIAREIQESLLPASSVTTSWCTVAGLTIPASEVGGDYFDIVALGTERMVLAIADVTGHGVGAGILSAMTKSALHAQLGHKMEAPGVLANLNRTIYEVSDEKMFVTFAYVLLDASKRAAELSTAGHPPVLIRKRTTGSVEQYRSISLALGIRDHAEYTSTVLSVESGDKFLLYTDGVVEALNADGDQFGMDRLLSVFSASAGTPAETCGEIREALRTFTGNDTYEDDVSLLCATMS